MPKLANINYPYLRYTALILLAPALAIISLAICFCIPGIFSGKANIALILSYLKLSFFSGILFAYPIMLLFGIPALIFLRALNKNLFVHYALLGIIGGFAATAVIFQDIKILFSSVSLFFVGGGFFCASFSWAFLYLPIKKSGPG